MIIGVQLYGGTRAAVLGLGLDLTGTRLALLTGDYVFDSAHSQWADVATAEISGGAYPAGGKPLGGAIADGAYHAAGGKTVFDGLEHTFSYGVLVSGDTLLGCLTFNEGNPIHVSGYDFEVTWSELGVFRLE